MTGARPGRTDWPVPLIPRVIATVTAVFLALNLAAPFMVEPGSVRGLDGGANMVDHADRWKGMHPVPGALYWFGDFNCHQMESRTLVLNDNQMPFCSRDTGIFAGIIAGTLLLSWSVPRPNFGRTAMSVLPRPLRPKIRGKYRPVLYAVLVWGLLLVPTGIDGFRQALTDYESTNAVRLLTGFTAGVALGVLLLSPIVSAFAPWTEEDVREFFPARDPRRKGMR